MLDKTCPFCDKPVGDATEDVTGAILYFDGGKRGRFAPPYNGHNARRYHHTCGNRVYVEWKSGDFGVLGFHIWNPLLRTL